MAKIEENKPEDVKIYNAPKSDNQLKSNSDRKIDAKKEKN